MKELGETVADGLSTLVGWAVISIAGGVLWIVRRVFTNQKQIEMLQVHLEDRDRRHERDRQDLQEVKRDVKELNRNVLTLFREKE